MRTKLIAPERILEATIQYAAKHGLENVSTAKIAAGLGISEGTIFHNFPTKRALLVQCLLYIDTVIDQSLKGASFLGLSIEKSIRSIWSAYLRCLVSHEGYARYYQQFRHSSYYDMEVQREQEKSFSFFTKLLRSNTGAFAVGPEILWVYIVETTLNYAVLIAEKRLPDDEKTMEEIFELLYHGIRGVLKLPSIRWFGDGKPKDK